MSRTYIVVEVEDSVLKDRPLGDGVKLMYTVDPWLRLFKEGRPLDAVLASAVDKGYEVSYAGDGRACAPWVWEKVELAVLADLRTRLSKNVRSFAVSIRPLARIVDYGR